MTTPLISEVAEIIMKPGFTGWKDIGEEKATQILALIKSKLPKEVLTIDGVDYYSLAQIHQLLGDGNG